MKPDKIILFIISIIVSNNTIGQYDNYIYRTDIKELLEETYDFEHTFLHVKNNRVPYLDCNNTNETDSLEFGGSRAVNFLDHIVEVIPDETNTVIISENHLVYQSRDLLLDFIKQLKGKGFTNVYIEALAYDIDIKRRGYPIKISGYLLNETTMANLVRELIVEEFNIYPYEEQNFQRETSRSYVLNHFKEEKIRKKIHKERINSGQYDLELMSSFLKMSTRDFSQYKNILQTFDPSEKSIILCGHGHGMKKPYGGWRPLGYWLSLNPRVNLFSIENSTSIGQEESELNKITCFFNQSAPYYVIDTSQNLIYSETRYQPYESKHVGDLFDMNIFYPVNYINQEDNYIPNQSNYEELILDIDDYNFPLLIIKYISDEYEIEKELAIPTGIEIIRQSSNITKIKVCENEIVIIWDGIRKTKIGN